MKPNALHVLSRLQRELDPLDIEGLSQLWQRAQFEASVEQYTSTFPPKFSGIAQPSISDWAAFVDSYLSPHIALDHTAPLPADLPYYILAYLLSATFKDCSIMIKLSGSTHSSEPSPITFIDLEPKSVAKLAQWEELDTRIVQAYAAGLQDKECVDAWKLTDAI